MRFSPRPSRRLTLVLVFLLYALSCRHTLHQNNTSPALFWLQVPIHSSTTTPCLNWFGELSECSSVNLWLLDTTAEEGKREFTVRPAEFPDSCLQRSRSFLPLLQTDQGPSVKVVSCGPNVGKRSRWTLDELNNFLSVPRGVGQGRALGYPSSSMQKMQAISIAAAAKSAVFFKVIPMVAQHQLSFVEDQHQANEGAAVSVSAKTASPWVVCPKTSLKFPRSTSVYFPNEKRHAMTFVGSDVYTKNVYSLDWKVYTAALYVSDAYRGDKSLDIYNTFQPLELASDELFFETLLSAESKHSRALVLKLALDLKCSLLIEGLMTEMAMSPANKAELFSSVRGFADQSCPRGLELVFHIRGEDGSLEILFLPPNRPIIRSIIDRSKRGVGLDFFRQFLLGPEPVTPGLKFSVGSGWASFLNKGSESPSHADTDVPTERESGGATKRERGAVPRLAEKVVRVLQYRVPTIYLSVLDRIPRLSALLHAGRTKDRQRWRVKMSSMSNTAHASSTFFSVLGKRCLEALLLVFLILLLLPQPLFLGASKKVSSSKSS